jgi:hypothetical protein
VRRTAAELIAPAPRDDDDDAAAAVAVAVAVAKPAHPAGGPADSDARIDAARDRLRGSVPPQNGDGAEER